MAQKPTLPKGTRDFSPTEVIKRNYILDIVKKHFQIFGFQPIETPSFENSETLMGKYGEEGDRLIFKILNSGSFISNSDEIIKNSIDLDLIINKEFFKFFYHNYIEKDGLLTEKVDQEQFYKLSDNDKKVIKDCLQKSVMSNKDYIKNKLIDGDKIRLINDAVLSNFETLLSYTYNIVSVIKTYGDNEKYFISYVNRLKIELLNSYYSKLLSKSISEKALRYDLTVPFARYVVMHQNEIDFPFKRYQIQPVWRADRPQKGRFREFYQCDADVVGANSLLQEVELIQLYDAVFTDLKLRGVSIHLNNRKILAGIAEVIGAKEKLIDFTVTLDKLDKIGVEAVKKEMLEKAISASALEKLQPLFTIQGNNTEKLSALGELLKDSEEGSNGVAELFFIIQTLEELGLQSAKLGINVTLARGLNYYTGTIMEVSAPENVSMGSIGGGGRYDDLTGIFGLKDVSGVGISFGLDRIYLVLEELKLFPEDIEQSLEVLCTNFGEKEALVALKLIGRIRKEGIKADLYPTAVKMQKQLKYANSRKVPFVILIGEEELRENKFVVKDMLKGKQEIYSLDNPGAFIQQLATEHTLYH